MTAKFKSKREGQKGQMAVFIALIFQVLFVFFAMVINIGLVVHDKINLQNAVDLSAYYAAQRQAEWLNLLAHQNYQIRQAYKLMVWRYRVLGTMGSDLHPARVADTSNNVSPDVANSIVDPPFACIAYKPGWSEVFSRESVCKDRLTVDRVTRIISEIRVQPIINIFGGWNFSVADQARIINRTIAERCQAYGGMNYIFSNLVKFAYRNDQYRIKQAMLAIGRNLAQPGEQVLDVNGATIFEGAKNTFEKNLTIPNLSSGPSFQLFNSLEGVPPEAWLNEIKVNLNLLYVDISSGDGCNAEPQQSTVLPANGDSRAFIQQTFGISADEMQAQFQEPPSTDMRRMSLGFEKNPWYKLYVGVRAKSKPRQLFFPFGEPMQFEAVAYASPFGGRLGPWYGSSWPVGAQSSTGTQLDGLLPPLSSVQQSGMTNAQRLHMLPNYSRFPGDQLGLTSGLAQAGLKALSGFQARLADYTQFFNATPGSVPDFLAWNPTLGPQTQLRRYEMAAVAPDLFDVTYYSIDPDFGRTFLPKLNNLWQRLGIPQDSAPRGDLGSRPVPAEMAAISVQEQMAMSGARSISMTAANSGLQNIHRPEAFYFIRDRAHLLTSWVHNDVVADYTEFPEGRFAKCGYWDDELKYRAPGACIGDGGRTGYSVKLISGKYLRSGGTQYGGPNQRGVILNPPPETW